MHNNNIPQIIPNTGNFIKLSLWIKFYTFSKIFERFIAKIQITEIESYTKKILMTHHDSKSNY